MNRLIRYFLIFILVLITLVSVSSVYQNKIYDHNNQKVTVRDKDNKDVFSVRLLENTDQCFNCETIYEVCNYQTKSMNLKNWIVKFYKKNNIGTQKGHGLKVNKSVQYTAKQKVYGTCSREIVVWSNLNTTSEIQTKNYSCVTGYKDVQRTKYIWDDFKNYVLHKDECKQIKVTGTLTAQEKVDNRLFIEGTEIDEFVWWNNDWTRKYPVDLNDSAGISYENMPIRLDTSSFTCNFGDFRDLRVVQNGAEIPREIINNSGQVFFFYNRTANAGQEAVDIYCDNSGASEPTYDLGFSVDNIGGSAKDFTVKWAGEMWLEHENGLSIMSDAGNISALSIGEGINERRCWEWREDSNSFWFGSHPDAESSVCTLQENNSLMYSYNCSHSGRAFRGEYYATDYALHMSDFDGINADMWIGCESVAGGSTADKHLFVRTGAGAYSTLTNQGYDTNIASEGVGVSYAGSQNIGVGTIWNASINGAYNKISGFWDQADTDDPFHMIFASDGTSTGMLADIREYSDSDIWVGYFNRSQEYLSNRYNHTQNPIIISVGAEEIVNRVPYFDETFASTTTAHHIDLSIQFNATDPDADALTFSVNNTGLVNMSSDGLMEDNPTISDVGTHSLEVNVSDGSLTNTTIFDYIVTNDAPTWTQTITSTGLFHSTNLNLQLNATDPNSDSLTWDIDNAIVNIDQSGLITDNPTISDVGNHSLVANATDGLQTILMNITYEIKNNPPTFDETFATASVFHNENLSIQINATDPNSDSLTWFDNTSLFNIDGSGNIFDNPTQSEYGNYSIRINVTDSQDMDNFVFTYEIINNAPQFTEQAPNINSYHNNSFGVQINATDNEQDSITYSVNSSLVTINQSGYLSDSNISYAELGLYEIVVTLNDSIETSTSTFSLNITGYAPTFESVNFTSASSIVGTTFNIKANVSDADDNISTVKYYLKKSNGDWYNELMSYNSTSTYYEADFKQTAEIGTYYLKNIVFNDTENNVVNHSLGLTQDITLFSDPDAYTGGTGGRGGRQIIEGNVTINQTIVEFTTTPKVIDQYFLLFKPKEQATHEIMVTSNRKIIDCQTLQEGVGCNILSDNKIQFSMEFKPSRFIQRKDSTVKLMDEAGNLHEIPYTVRLFNFMVIYRTKPFELPSFMVVAENNAPVEPTMFSDYIFETNHENKVVGIRLLFIGLILAIAGLVFFAIRRLFTPKSTNLIFQSG